MNAMRRPSAPLMMMDGVSLYLTCTQTNTRLSIARTVAATTVSAGCQWKAAGTISPTVQTSSRMPRAVQASRGNAPKDGTPFAYLVEHEDLHDARRSVQERGEDLQDPQQDVHRVPPPGLRVGISKGQVITFVVLP